MLERLEKALLALLVVSYVGINFGAELPRFLIGENIFWTALYMLGLLLLYSRRKTAYPFIVFVAAFNAGRVSRSIFSPHGEIGELALQHIPLATLLLVTGFIALFETVKNSVGGEN